MQLYDALNDMADTGNKLDVRVAKFLLKQKDCVIYELQERVKILVQHVKVLTKQAEYCSAKYVNDLTKRADHRSENHEATSAHVKSNNTQKEIVASDNSDSPRQIKIGDGSNSVSTNTQSTIGLK